MLFDIFFFGLPLIFAICLAVCGVRHEELRYWRPAFSLFAYCAFYLAGGREIVLFVTTGAMIMSGVQGIDVI